MSTAIESSRSISTTHPGRSDVPSISTADDWFSVGDTQPFSPSPPIPRRNNTTVTESIPGELEKLDAKKEKVQNGRHDGGSKKSTSTVTWDVVLKGYMAGVDPIDEEPSSTSGLPSMRTMWIESPRHSMRSSTSFTQSEIAAVDETVADQSVFGDDHVTENEPDTTSTVDSPTIKDKYQTGSLPSEDTESFIHVAPGFSIDGSESQVRESIDGSESSFVQIDHPTAGVFVTAGPSEAASSSSTLALKSFLSNTLFRGGSSGQSQDKTRSRL